MNLRVLRQGEPAPERRRPGRLPLAHPDEAVRENQRTVTFYRQMVRVADNVLVALGRTPGQPAPVGGTLEAREHQRQVAYWAGVREQAMRMLAGAPADAV